MGVQDKIRIETEAARSLVANIRDVLAGDEQTTVDMVEGETNLLEAITEGAKRVGEIEAMHEAIDTHVKALQARKARLGNQGDMIRQAILVAMGAAEIKKLELPIATITRKPTAPKAEILNEADIPSQFWKAQDPKLDRKAVLDALKEKQEVPGAILSNGGEALQIRFG